MTTDAKIPAADDAALLHDFVNLTYGQIQNITGRYAPFNSDGSLYLIEVHRHLTNRLHFRTERESLARVLSADYMSDEIRNAATDALFEHPALVLRAYADLGGWIYGADMYLPIPDESEYPVIATAQRITALLGEKAGRKLIDHLHHLVIAATYA